MSNISLIHDNDTRYMRIAHQAFLGFHTVNGVSALHTDLLRKTVFHDLAKTTPTQIVNKTNGITFRRWLFDANEGLTTLLTKALGERVLDDPRCLAELESVADDVDFVAQYKKMRADNKGRLADMLHSRTGVRLPP